MTDPRAGEESTKEEDQADCEGCNNADCPACRFNEANPPNFVTKAGTKIWIPEERAGREATAINVTPTFGRPTVEEILEEWAAGRTYGETSHFIKEFSKVALAYIESLKAQLAAQPSVLRTQDELKAEMATLTAAETGSAWQLLYGLYGELPIPEKDGWKIAALLIRITAERGSK